MTNLVDLNAWLAAKYNQGRPRIETREFYKRLYFQESGSREWTPIKRSDVLAKYGGRK